MHLKKINLSLSLTLFLLGIFTSTVRAQTVSLNTNHLDSNTNTAKYLLAQAEENPEPELRFAPRVGAAYITEGAGYNPYGSFGIFFPILQNPGKSLTFIEGKMLWDTDTDSLGGNILLGHRVINDTKDRITGGYVSYDTRNTGRGVFNQLGVGFESLGNWDFHINGYLPIGKTSNQLSENVLASPSFVGNSLHLDRVQVFQQAFSGVDAEVGTKLASFSNGALRAYAGSYVYSSEGIPAFVGVRGRLVGTWNNLAMGLSLSNDSQFDTRLVFNIGASLGGVQNRNDNQSVLARMGDSVHREPSIIVDNRVVRDTVPAINSNGGVITLFSLADNQSGNLGATLASARPSDIVYVQAGTNTNVGSFTVPSQVQVLSSGPVQVVSTQAGNVQIPGSGTGILPRSGTITLATNGSNQVVSGFAVTNTPGQPGIVGTNNTNASILQNQVTINGANTNTLLAGRGIVLVGANGSTNISNNTVRNAIGEGIRLDNVSGKASINNNTVLNTIQPQTQTGLEASIFIRNNRGDVDLTIANNIVGDNNTRSSFNNDGVTPAVGNEIDGIEFSLCRSYAAPVLDTFAKCSGTATAKVAILNNTIRNIGAIGTDGADGIDINLNNGDDNTDTGARASNITISGNRISNIADKGVSFGVDGDAVLGQGIVTNNQVDTVGDIGLALRSRFNSTSNYTVTGNTINNARNNGIEYILTRNDNNSVSTGIVSNNTISNSGSNGIALGARGTGQQTVIVSNNTITNTLTTGNTRGIDVQTQENGKLQLTLDTNTISGSRLEAIRIRTGTNAGVSGGNSQVNASVKNNNIQLSNNTAGTANGALTASSANNSNFCLALRNNRAGATANTGYFFSRSGSSIFRVENALLSSNIGTFSPALPLSAPPFTNVVTDTCGLP
ncbi:MAG: hypothetical protein IGS39_15175 [Calothrix sp. C42_A2020_038]|nr:hypothetical protein [Calothrix sp. C42_A2020_038]